MKRPLKVVGYAYSRQWDDGTVGWQNSKYILPGHRSTPARYLDEEGGGKDERLILCKFTIVPVKDKLGRFITRKLKPKEKP